MKLLLLPLLAASCLLSSCGTRYQEIGTDATGGFSTVRKSEDVFMVSFDGNGFTRPKQAKDFAKLRAAEVTLEHNFRYFSILGNQDRSTNDTVDMGSHSYTTGSVGPYGTFNANTTTYNQTVPVHRPKLDMLIRCFVKPPGGHSGPVEDATQVRNQLRAQYKLDKTR